jgi:hypothetical protein
MQGKANFELGPELPQQHVNLEVDRTHQRQYGHWMMLGLVLVAALLFNIWQRDTALKQVRRIDDLGKEREQAQLVAGHLLIEIYSLSSPEKIDQFAVNRLHLVPAGREDTFYLPRTFAAPQPPSSVVASR